MIVAVVDRGIPSNTGSQDGDTSGSAGANTVFEQHVYGFVVVPPGAQSFRSQKSLTVCHINLLYA